MLQMSYRFEGRLFEKQMVKLACDALSIGLSFPMTKRVEKTCHNSIFFVLIFFCVWALKCGGVNFILYIKYGWI